MNTSSKALGTLPIKLWIMSVSHMLRESAQNPPSGCRDAFEPTIPTPLQKVFRKPNRATQGWFCFKGIFITTSRFLAFHRAKSGDSTSKGLRTITAQVQKTVLYCLTVKLPLGCSSLFRLHDSKDPWSVLRLPSGRSHQRTHP